MGGRPSSQGTGGSSYGDANLSQFIFGSGGGGGNYTVSASDGANGGGIVYIITDTLTINGNITSKGGISAQAVGAWTEGGGGGGGPVYLKTNTLTLGTDTIQTIGGASHGQGLHGTYSQGGHGPSRLEYATINSNAHPNASNENTGCDPDPTSTALTDTLTTVTNEYISIGDTEGQKIDTSSWLDIHSGSVTETLNSQNVYYWLAFDSASSFGVGTEIKIFNSTDSVWRVIAKNNAGTWEYNNDSGNSATYTGSNAAVNDMLHAISQAISTQSGNRMTGTNLAAITDTQWEESGGWSLSTDNIVRGVTLYSNDSSQNPSVSQYRLNYDSASSNALLTNRSFGNTGMPATPGSNITTLVLMVIDKQVSGTPTYEVSSNGGTTWNTISSWDTESTMANSYVARLAETNVTADTGARTDPLFRIRNGGTGESYELKGVSLKYK